MWIASTSAACTVATTREAERLAGARRVLVGALAALVALPGATMSQQPAPGREQILVVAPADEPPASVALVRAALGSSSRRVIFADSAAPTSLRRGESYNETVVVIGGHATVASVVHGDVVVIGGDLFVRPGASIVGRAVAIGGGVYPSTLARVGQGTLDFRDHTYDLRRTADGVSLVYRELEVAPPRTFELPLLAGLRIPTYDRVDGLSAAWGPITHVRGSEVEPVVTFRTHLGAIDPTLAAMVPLDRRTRLRLALGRETATNERWIRGDLLNSATAVFLGDDVRNYYRRDVGSLVLEADRIVRRVEVRASAGVRTERAWSVGQSDTVRSAPWSLFGRDDAEREGRLRANPPIDRGRISSVLVNVRARWQLEDVVMTAVVSEELPWQAPRDGLFAQTILDLDVAFPTFGLQRITIGAHAMLTIADSTPRQRWSYIGGPSTLSILEPPLSAGGDMVFFAESRYEIPIQRIRLPLVGSPSIILRHLVGSAGVQELPTFVQHVGFRVALGFVRADYLVDPATQEQKVSVGLSMMR